MTVWLRRCRSFAEEAEADREFWTRFSPDERVAMVEQMRREWMEKNGQRDEGLRRTARLLETARVRFVVVGAHALAYHAKPRYTKDFDLFLQADPMNGERVVAALEEFGFGGLGIVPEDFASTGRILQLGVPPNRIDLMTSIDGVDFEEVWSTRVEGAYGGQIVPFIGKAALIKNKTASRRPQDLADLELLRNS